MKMHADSGVATAKFYIVWFALQPVICLPFFADQYDVAARVVDSGAGLQLDKTTFTPEDVKEAVRVHQVCVHVLQNES